MPGANARQNEAEVRGEEGRPRDPELDEDRPAAELQQKRRPQPRGLRTEPRCAWPEERAQWDVL